jgi:hypothetical protein
VWLEGTLTGRIMGDRPGSNRGERRAAGYRRDQNTNRNNTSSMAMTKAMMAIVRVFSLSPPPRR